MKRFDYLVLACFLLCTAACGSARPQVKVLGATPAATRPATQSPPGTGTVVVFVEVVNSTSRELKLSGLEYRLAADTWFESRGRVRLSRAITPGGSAVVEIPVTVSADAHVARAGGDGDGGVSYRLEGRLFAVDDRVERSWPVSVQGAFPGPGQGDRALSQFRLQLFSRGAASHRVPGG
jgi:hypothetical protein